MTVYIGNLKDRKIVTWFTTRIEAKNYMASHGLTANYYVCLEDTAMDYVSTITYIDGQCVYNNVKFWLGDLTDIMNNYSSHTVLDNLKQPVTFERFMVEYRTNTNRMYALDGEPGQMMYNIRIGNEFISLVRAEFKHTALTTYNALNYANDMADVSSLVMLGAPREATWVLEATGPNEFMTEERKAKYIEMLTAYDPMDYTNVVEAPIVIDSEDGTAETASETDAASTDTESA